MKATQQSHGLNGVKKATLMNSNDQLQSVHISDGGNGTVILSLSTSVYPAILCLEDARWIAKLLMQAAKREESNIRKGEA